MSQSRLKFSGEFFARLASASQPAVLEVSDGKVSIVVGGTLRVADAKVISVQDDKLIYLPEDMMFRVDSPLPEEALRSLVGKVQSAIRWLEIFTPKRAIVLSAILLVSLFVVRYAFLTFSHLIVAIFPHDWEQVIGRNSYESLRLTVLEASQLPVERQKRLGEKARELAVVNGISPVPDVKFHKSDLLGGNALAFPGGPVVVTDDLVELLGEDQLVVAVIAHEFAHIKARHSLQHIVDVIGLTAIVSVVLGADESLIEEASAIGISIWAMSNSRDFEREADVAALDMLETVDLPADSFIEAIQKLIEYTCSSQTTADFEACLSSEDDGWLSTHPTGAERLDYLTAHSTSR